MRLKELHIKGFKSFANDTKIHFNEDIIGIVGPNGSGKSNIVDSIRWVLGEQKNKDLRLDTMMDVIFNGTKTRKKGGYAEVSLTFDNTKNIIPTEYTQVRISRKIYRTGDSEYLINDVTCRLKDIRNMFLDTGIGSNSYAIIELGMVDDILSNNNNARRKMFEQAAGISKYKIRKRETLNKLKTTQVDLDRIEDILFELENSLKDLEKQARRTRKYYEIKENYKEIKIILSAFSYQNFLQQKKDIKSKIEQQELAYQDFRNQQIKQEAELQKIKTDNIQYERDLSEQQKKQNELTDLIRSLENKKEIWSSELKISKDEVQKLQILQQDLQSRQTDLNQGLAKADQRMNEATTASQSLINQFDSAKQQHEEFHQLIKQKRSDSHDQSNQLNQAQHAKFETEKKLAILKNNIDQHQLKIQNTQAEIDQSENDISSLKGQIEQSKAQKEKLQKNLKMLDESQANLEKKQGELSEKIQGFEQSLNQLNRQIDAKSNNRDLLKSMVDNLEGFPESAKFLKDNHDSDLVFLSDILDCKDDYKTAIEVFLDQYLKYYVVHNHKEAVNIITLLSDAQKGRANFFLMSHIEPQKIEADLAFAAVPAIDCVEVDGAYSKLIAHLLGHVYIVDEVPPKLHQLPQGVVILDKQGKLIISKDRVGGGSVGLFEGKMIGRKKSLQKLEADIKKLESKRIKLEDSLQASKDDLEVVDLSSIVKNKKELSFNIQQLDLQLAKWENTFESFDVGIQKKVSVIESSTTLINQYKEELVLLNATQVEAVQKITNLQNAISQQSEELKSFNEKMTSINEAFNSSNIEKIKAENLVNSIKQDRQYKREQLAQVDRQLKENNSSSQHHTQRINERTKGIVEVEKSLQKQLDIKTESTKNLSSAEQEYFKKKSEINEIEEGLRKINNTLQDRQISINELKSTQHNVQFEIQSIVDRLQIEFQVDNQAADAILMQQLDQSTDVTQLKLKVEKLQNRLNNYGEINPMAVSAFDEMKVRYDDITKQRNDIITAKDSLLQTIEEIENTATEKFMTAFNEVKENFGKVFSSLFSEDDQATLMLSDTSDPLNATIEIFAQPKGKRPRTLSQLSGGEKTLTATALLFSLYLLKPAPFCIFDEVDAPLDDANILKFTRLIRKFSGDSQFIIITHNKSTMAAVDVLYGVYMQEMGVSGLAPVDFSNYQHEAELV